MFDVGFLELIVIAVIGLLVMGPEKLPGAIRSGMLWMNRLRSSFAQIKSDFERELGTDEIKQQIHNESIMQDLSKSRQELLDASEQLRKEADALKFDMEEVDSLVDTCEPSTDQKTQ